MTRMKHLQFLLFLICSVSFIGVKAQQNHFIYLQTENRQPFYVKLENKLFSSTSSGYLVLSKLKSGSYNLAIGFPKSEWAEQNLPCTIASKDLGFILKNFGEKGWGLFNLQTLDVVMADERKATNVVSVETKTDEFSNLLSNVVNDPTIKQVEKIKEPEVPVSVPASTTEVAVTENAPANVPPVVVTTAEPVPDKTSTSQVKRTLSNTTSMGTEMVFTDQVNGSTDTVIVFIPAEVGRNTEAAAKSPAPVESKEEKPAVVETVAVIPGVPEEKKTAKENSPSIEYNPKPEEKVSVKRKKQKEKKDSRFIDVSMSDSTVVNPTSSPAPVEKKASEQKASEEKAVAKTDNQPQIIMAGSPMINSDCKAIANDGDFMKLRKKMVGEDSDDDMIAIAKKAFKSKCYMVDQVRNLSVLFLKDDAKYAFFDMAYPHVSDSHNYKDLQGQLSDPYYVNRFKVMIRQ